MKGMSKYTKKGKRVQNKIWPLGAHSYVKQTLVKKMIKRIFQSPKHSTHISSDSI